MNLYTVHYRKESEASLTGLAQDVVLVRDGFNWSALFLPSIWFLSKKMWFVFGVYLVIQAALLVIVFWGELPTEVLTITKITGNLILGFEANNLQRWSLDRDRYRERETIAARDMVAAEHRFFSQVTSGRVFSRRSGEVHFADSNFAESSR
ncbi:hypothetical protein MNBD_ALPHA08-835 [hydrothermal vent metagenome]|uniref:DUF2628 domain-containing protein n=1 Tax=hydrothermal vent metagenome TaxID=652676 RepID=A0A3B0S9N3_9ZZZZ